MYNYPTHQIITVIITVIILMTENYLLKLVTDCSHSKEGIPYKVD